MLAKLVSMQVKDSTNINFKNNGEVIFSRGLDLHDFRYKYVETVNMKANIHDTGLCLTQSDFD